LRDETTFTGLHEDGRPAAGIFSRSSYYIHFALSFKFTARAGAGSAGTPAVRTSSLGNLEPYQSLAQGGLGACELDIAHLLSQEFFCTVAGKARPLDVDFIRPFSSIGQDDHFVIAYFEKSAPNREVNLSSIGAYQPYLTGQQCGEIGDMPRKDGHLTFWCRGNHPRDLAGIDPALRCHDIAL